MTFDREALERFDQNASDPTETVALAEGLESPNTRTAPRPFVCADGLTYWVKSQAHRGLANELICGRLADLVAAGPEAVTVRVTWASLDAVDDPGHVVPGLGCGSRDVPNAPNSKGLQTFIGDGTFNPGSVDPATRASAVVFQTWVGAHGDEQVLVGLSDGRVHVIDHELSLDETSSGSPTLIVTGIPGVPNNLGSETHYVDAALRRVDSLTDDQLLGAVAGVPSASGWDAPLERRLVIAQWLADRRSNLREVMEQW